MSTVLPPRFLFRFAIPVRYVGGIPRRKGALLNLPSKCIVPDLSELDAETPLAELRLAWNDAGLAVSVTIGGKKQPPEVNADHPAESDGLQIWLDTRNTQSVHRATRFCHHFCVLPGVGEAPSRAVQLPVARARDEAPLAKPDAVETAFELTPDGYRLDAWLPAECLHGFDPEANPRLGFYYYVRDRERGEQFLTVGREFPFSHDPSLWSTIELIR